MEIRTFAETLKFRVDQPHAAIGIVNGYFATFFAGKSGFSVVPYFSFPLSRDVDDELVAALRVSLADARVEVGAEKDVLFLAFDEPIATFRPDALDDVKKSLERVTNAIALRGLSQPTVCKFCGLPGADCYHYKGGVHRPVHAACLKEYLATEEPPSTPSKPVVDGATLVRSVLYALAGGLAGAVPAILASVWIPLLYPFFLALVPLGSFAGYKYGKGVVERSMILFVTLYDEFLALSVIFWFWNLSARAADLSLGAYLGLQPLASIIDAAIGMTMASSGIIASRRLLPARKL